MNSFKHVLLEKSKAQEDKRVEELKTKLENAVATRQEAEAKLIQAEIMIKELMMNVCLLFCMGILYFTQS